MAPLVSVVMPCFNAGRMLEPALWSVFAQSYPNLEIIFVDNNSNDGSAERARSFAAGKPRQFRFVQCPQQGANHARNMGYALASGDYIQWMDADDALGIEKIALQVKALEQDRDAAIAYCDWMASRHLADGRRVDSVMALNQADDQILRTLSGVWYPPHSYLVRREAADILQAERAWLPETTISDDVEYSAIAALLGMRFRHVAGAKVQYNTWSPSQLTGAGTPYLARISAFRNIWVRLREFAHRSDVAARLTAVHEMLLNLDWSVWAMPLGSVEIDTISAERHRLRHVASGRTLETSRRDATVATAMLAAGHGRPLLHHALLIAQFAPSLSNDIAGIVSALDGFRREGFLTAVSLTSGSQEDQAETAVWTTAKIAERCSGQNQDASTAWPGRVDPPSSPSAASPATRKAVAEAWTEVLGDDGLVENQRFDAAGGDSMALLNLALNCEARLAVPVPLDALSVRMRPSDIVGALDRILAENAGAPAETSTGKPQLPTIFLIRVRHQMDLSEPVLRHACAGRAQVVAIPLPAWPAFVEPNFDFSALLDHIVSRIEPRIGTAPVMLFGMCLGGFLAYLVAQRLAASGRSIGLVGIVDASPAWPIAGVPIQFQEELKAILGTPQFSGLAPAIAKFLIRHPSALRWLNSSGGMALLPRKFGTKLNWHINFDLPARFDRPGLARLMEANAPLDAPILLFRTLEQAEGAPADLHWRGRCAKVTVVPILGSHFSLFAPENVHVALQAFSQAVRRAMAACAMSAIPASLAECVGQDSDPDVGRQTASNDDDTNAGARNASAEWQTA